MKECSIGLQMFHKRRKMSGIFKECVHIKDFNKECSREKGSKKWIVSNAFHYRYLSSSSHIFRMVKFLLNFAKKVRRRPNSAKGVRRGCEGDAKGDA